MFSTDPILVASLLSLLLNSSGIALFMPMALSFITKRWTDNNHRKIAVYVTCFVVSLGACVYLGAFAPVAAIYAQKGLGPALWATVQTIGVSWGALTVVASQLYDKVYKPTQDAKNGIPDNGSPVSIGDVLEAQLKRRAGDYVSGLGRPLGIGSVGTVSNGESMKPQPLAPLVADEAGIHHAFDLAEGSPTLDVEHGETPSALAPVVDALDDIRVAPRVVTGTKVVSIEPGPGPAPGTRPLKDDPQG